jgi:hypothetical protein
VADTQEAGVAVWLSTVILHEPVQQIFSLAADFWGFNTLEAAEKLLFGGVVLTGLGWLWKRANRLRLVGLALLTALVWGVFGENMAEVIHFFQYMVVVYLLCSGQPSIRCFIAGIVLGFLDEAVQGWLLYKSSLDLRDILLDCIGCLWGAFLVKA